MPTNLPVPFDCTTGCGTDGALHSTKLDTGAGCEAGDLAVVHPAPGRAHRGPRAAARAVPGRRARGAAAHGAVADRRGGANAH